MRQSGGAALRRCIAAGIFFAAAAPAPVRAAMVDSYDQSFSLLIPDSWHVTPKEAFKGAVPEIAAGPAESESLGLQGLIITRLEGSTQEDLKAIASYELEKVRAKRFPQNNPSPVVESIQFKEGSVEAYYFRTGNKPDSEMRFYFFLQDKNLRAVCPNIYETECKEALASIGPSIGNPGRQIQPKLRGFSIRVPPDWSVTRDWTGTFSMVHPPDLFQIRKPSARTNLKSQPEMEKALWGGIQLAYGKLRVGPSRLQTFKMRGSAGNEDIGKLYFVTGIHATRGNILAGYLITRGGGFLIVAESRRSLPIGFILPILSTWENR